MLVLVLEPCRFVRDRWCAGPRSRPA
jgi:hypothetical protein